MLEGKRIAILVEEGFEDSELMEPLWAMKGGGNYRGFNMNQEMKGGGNV